MKITNNELLEYNKNSIYEQTFNWMDFDNILLRKISDKELLGKISQISLLKMAAIPGCGLIAELCRRFNLNKE